MRKFIQFILIFTIFFTGVTAAYSQDRYKYVIEESFYVIKPENTEKFLRIFKDKLMPFWSEMQNRGVIVGEFRLYTQRLHTLDPHWTYKTVVVFKNYEAV